MSWATSASPMRRRGSSTSASKSRPPPAAPSPPDGSSAPLRPPERLLRRAVLWGRLGMLWSRSPAAHSGTAWRPPGKNRLVSFTISDPKGEPFPLGFSRKMGRSPFPLVLFQAVTYNRDRNRLRFFGNYMTVAHFCATVSKLFYPEKRDRLCQNVTFKKSSPPTAARSPSASSGPATTWASTPWPCTPRRTP